jgi:hypothetical protein
LTKREKTLESMVVFRDDAEAGKEPGGSGRA